MSAEVAAEPLSTNERAAQVNARVSQVVRTLLAARNLTIKQLAEKTDLDEDTLGRRLRGAGKHGWLAAEIDAVADALDADVSLFFEAVPINWFRRSKDPKPAVLRRAERHLSLVKIIPVQSHPLVTNC